MKHTQLLHSQMLQAIKSQDITKVKNMIAQGVKVNYVNHSSVSSAIEAATEVGSYELVEFLISVKADPNRWYMESPLTTAINNGFIDIANLLIDAGADVNLDANCQITPLHAAVHFNSIQLVKRLIDAGADVNAGGKESNPALSVAGACGHVEIFEYLFPLVEPNYLSKFLEEALLMAVTSESMVGIDFLVSQGVNINCRNYDQMTPLIFALSNGHPAPAKRLIELGANITLCDQNGHNALNYALERNNHALQYGLTNNYSEIVKLLKQGSISD